MSWKPVLRSKTRDPQFLWTIAIVILSLGLLLAFASQWLPATVTNPLIGARADELDELVEKIDQLAAAGQWQDVFISIPQLMWRNMLPGPVAIACVAGFSWLVFLIQAGQPSAADGIRWWLCLPAVALGALSVWPTLMAVFFQEQQWGFTHTTETIAGLRFFILGVALREELCKLLLFLPLVPWIIRGGSQREALLVAGCVGLGFAIEENIGYFAGDPSSTLSRFLTANFLHISLTGLIGLALCRAIWWPREWLSDSIGTILLAIVLHGVYDALIALPALVEYNIGSSIIHILLAYRFFHELRAWWVPRGETISLSATVVAAVSLITAASYVYFAAATDLRTATDAVIMPAISSGILVYMFLREVPESLIR